ncbi:uncharacterized protein LOC118764058 [Octopus sinensis]|uniref:Uncharacterized protein LOC118764058 n=1 Tax=Octopus sinensis TaxID=2607531 RepID=A0A7E6EZW8_9MOLL|nr:uncharacterized protein LOC118764058 [Octopus sinensis]
MSDGFLQLVTEGNQNLYKLPNESLKFLKQKHSIAECFLRACFRQIINIDEDNDFPLPLTRKCSSCRRKLEKVRNAEMSRSAQTPTANTDKAEATQKDCTNTSSISESDSTISSIHRRNNIPAEQDKYQTTDFTPNMMRQFHPEAQSSKFAENLQMTRSAGNMYISSVCIGTTSNNIAIQKIKKEKPAKFVISIKESGLKFVKSCQNFIKNPHERNS